MTTTYEVHLAVYDLSRGMARSLSGQFLGADHALDLIPHTGLVVFGKEYFYGGGIQSESPHVFRQSTGMVPISTELLGRTTVAQDEFEAWCLSCMQNGRFTMESYDLLERNCNNFSHEAAIEGLRLPRGIPEWILNVPRRFLACPMGQMIRPMLEGMQVTGGHDGGSGSAAPFANAAPSLQTTTTDTDTSAATNPWANMPPSVSSTTSPSNTSVSNKTDTLQQLTSTPVLDSYTRPLLSNDTKTAGICASKLIASSNNDTDKTALQELSDTLARENKPSEKLVEAASKAILAQLHTGENSTFALMLLRLVMLYPPPPSEKEETCSFYQCMDWVHQQLTAENGNSSLQSPAGHSMAWCCLSNLYGVSPSTLNSSLDTTVEAAIRDLTEEHQSRVEVRQAATAFLYNVSLFEGKKHDGQDEMDDVVVSLLCACLDGGVVGEPDATCKLRRILVAAKLVKPNASMNEAAKSLVKDLGFVDSLHDITVSSSEPNASGDAVKVQQVAAEFIRILES